MYSSEMSNSANTRIELYKVQNLIWTLLKRANNKRATRKKRVPASADIEQCATDMRKPIKG